MPPIIHFLASHSTIAAFHWVASPHTGRKSAPAKSTWRQPKQVGKSISTMQSLKPTLVVPNTSAAADDLTAELNNIFRHWPNAITPESVSARILAGYCGDFSGETEIHV